MNRRLAAGASIDGFKECVGFELARERIYRHEEPRVEEHDLLSGSDPSNQILYGYSESYRGGLHTVFSTALRDKDFFHTVIVDDDAEDGSYKYEHRPNRPLVEGDYKVRFDFQRPIHQPCDADIESVYHYNVTVTAPDGTLHEAFFDPVTIGTAVGADATNGVLKPTSFTVGETATQITDLKRENNQAVLTLSPHVSLASYALDFIELDGSVSLTLQAKDATVDSAAGTHTWSVTDQPWHNGDKLMLRIRDTQRPPSFDSETYNFTVAENASSYTIIGTALATDPDEGDEVLHTIESGNEGGKFQIDGFAGFIVVRGALDYETTSSYTLTIKADDGKGGTDTATVNITITDVAE